MGKPSIKSKYKGVSFDRFIGKFYSCITHDGTTYPGGYHVSDREAAKLRDLAIIRHNLPLEKLQILSPPKKQ